MTRAILLLERGEVVASWHMHPLAVPSLLASVAFMIATVWATARFGSPLAVWQSRAGRAGVVSFAMVQAALLVLWVARMIGWFGGPVAV
jgi:hypothetical protein